MKWKVGQKVVHTKYNWGIGTVIEINSVSEIRPITVKWSESNIVSYNKDGTQIKKKEVYIKLYTKLDKILE